MRLKTGSAVVLLAAGLLAGWAVGARAAPTVTGPAVSPNPFSPNADGVKDTTTITASFSGPVTWTLDIKHSNGQIVRSFSGAGTSLSVPWDGKTAAPVPPPLSLAAGVVVPDRTYDLVLTATDGSGSTPATGTVVVDTAAFATIDAVDNPITTANVAAANVAGTAEPGASVKVIFKKGVDVTPAVATVADALGDWSVSADATSVGDGTIQVKAVVGDAAGNSTTVTRDTFKDTAPPSLSILAWTNPINGANQSAVATQGLTDPGSSVSVLVGGSVPAVASVDGTGAWVADGIDASSVPDGPAVEYAVTSTDPFGNSITKVKTAAKDTVAPPLAITSLTDPITDANKNNATARGTTEFGASIQVVATNGAQGAGPVPGTVQTDGTWASHPLDLTGKRNGTWTFTATATDPAGNSTTASDTATKNADATPAVDIADGGDGFVGPADLNDGKIQVNVRLDGDPGVGDATVSVKLGTTSLGTLTYAVGDSRTFEAPASGFADGDITAVATVGSITGEDTAVLDLTQPAITIDPVLMQYASITIPAEPLIYISIGNAKFTGTADDSNGISQVEVTISNADTSYSQLAWLEEGEDGVTWTGDFSNWDLDSGDYVLTATSKDSAGNTQSATAAITIN